MEERDILNNTFIRIPAIRGVQGNRIFYSCAIPIKSLTDEWFTRSEPAVERAQRPPIPGHVKAITEYISKNSLDYVLGSLTFAVDSEIRFEALSTDSESEIGFVYIDREMTLHSLDGQHRFKAILEAVKSNRNLLNQSIGLLIYIESDLSRKKQMFSDMNSTPKRVPKGLNIAFDNRDPFGRAAQMLVNSHPVLKDRTEMFASRVIANSSNFYSLSSVHDTLKKLHVGSIGRVKNPEQYVDKEIAYKGSLFFDFLYNSRSEFADALQSQIKLQNYRKKTILFNSTTLRVIAGAFYLMERDWGGDESQFFNEMERRFRLIDFKVNSRIFVNCGFVDKNSSTPNARNQQVAAGTKALFDQLTKIG